MKLARRRILKGLLPVPVSGQPGDARGLILGAAQLSRHARRHILATRDGTLSGRRKQVLKSRNEERT